MRIRDNETTNERIYRQNILNKQTNKVLPVILILIIPLIVCFLWMYSNQINASQYGIGDPYRCRDCNTLSIACKKHRGFNVKEEINREIDVYSLGFKPDMSRIESLEAMYGEGKTLNNNCDYCLEGKTEISEECYGCSYERNRIDILATEITKDEVFKTKLCNKCWKLEYANCSICRNMLATTMKQKIDNNK